MRELDLQELESVVGAGWVKKVAEAAAWAFSAIMAYNGGKEATSGSGDSGGDSGGGTGD